MRIICASACEGGCIVFIWPNAPSCYASSREPSIDTAELRIAYSWGSQWSESGGFPRNVALKRIRSCCRLGKYIFEKAKMAEIKGLCCRLPNRLDYSNGLWAFSARIPSTPAQRVANLYLMSAWRWNRPPEVHSNIYGHSLAKSSPNAQPKTCFTPVLWFAFTSLVASSTHSNDNRYYLVGICRFITCFGILECHESISEPLWIQPSPFRYFSHGLLQIYPPISLHLRARRSIWTTTPGIH